MKEVLNNNPRIEIVLADALEELKNYDDNVFDCLATDPPAGISWFDFKWDNFGSKPQTAKERFIQWLTAIAKEIFRVLKPGAHAVVWALPRTSHWTATAFEDAGFEIRDRLIYISSSEEKLQLFLDSLTDEQKTLFLQLIDESRLQHLFASGIPKGYAICNAVESQLKLGVSNCTYWKRLDGIPATASTGLHRLHYYYGSRPKDYSGTPTKKIYITTEEAKAWLGWDTALKPAVEDWWLMRKPLEKGLSLAKNVLKWKTGGINIDGIRQLVAGDNGAAKTQTLFAGENEFVVNNKSNYPSNVMVDNSDEVQDFLKTNASKNFFKCIYLNKAVGRERREGLKPNDIVHPTTKPIKLMQYLLTLICPPNGLVLDPFMGSGVTGVAAFNLKFNFIGIEKEENFFNLARNRILYFIEKELYGKSISTATNKRNQ